MKTHNRLIGMLGLLMACQPDEPNCLPYVGEVVENDGTICAGMLVKVTNRDVGSRYGTVDNVISVVNFDVGVDTSAINFTKKIYFDFRPDGLHCLAIFRFFSPH